MADNEPSAPRISSDPVGLKPGEIFWNNYRVIGIIGKGGVSTVYKAENMQTKQLVAIKVLHAHKTHDEELVRRFVREAQTTSKLDEQHAIHIYEWGIDKSERPFMIMEYLSGETLTKRIQRGNGLNCGKAVEIMEQICSAVTAAHALGIIHRDLKPDNVMLITRDGLE
ncbi:MAG: serine/threonine protein kinase, partial [Candidatus Melainabacteria bacterium]|nr:serine/threonine protein kinase [Candidatus Melainabacteria bacterium]